MNKRVHEIAKERGLEAKYVLARLKAAGVDVKASSSSVDEEVARRVLSNGGDSKNRRSAPARTEESDPPAKAAASTKRKPAPAATAQRDETVRPVRDEPAPDRLLRLRPYRRRARARTGGRARARTGGGGSRRSSRRRDAGGRRWDPYGRRRVDAQASDARLAAGRASAGQRGR